MGTGAVLLAIGLAIIAFAFGIREREKRRMRSWPVAAGVVTKLLERVGPTVHYRGSFTQEAIQIAVYTYTVGGVAYAGEVQNNYTRSAGFVNQAFHDRYPVGRSLEVHYDPTYPSKSLVDARSAASLSMTFIGVVFAALGLLILLARR